MLGLDEAHEIAKSVFADAQLHFADIKTEEDAKLRIITRILTEVLGWKHSDISSERINENGYSDYLINDDTHGVLILEAKKVGLINVNTQATTKQNYKISGPALKDALLGIQQAASYCAPNGIQLAVLTDGYTWIVFRPFIPDERYQDKQAITFPGFEAVLSDFATFYELISKFSCKKNTYKLIFDNIHENRLTQTQGLTAAFSGSDIRIEQKSSLAFDLEKVFSRFFSSLAGDDDPDLLIDCFVETRESRVADFSLEKITQNVLGNIAISEKSVDEGLDTLIQSAILEEAGQTVFIVGPSGAGKTTFLDRFFKRTLSSIVREQCVILNVNFIDSTGDANTYLTWVTNQIIDRIERQIFPKGHPEWSDLQALYHGDYVRRSEGVDAYLYKRNKDEFKEKFSIYVDEKVEKDREGYLSRLLRDIVSNRKKLPIIVVDNTDEFDLSYKEIIFQYFQALRRSTIHCLLIFPVTDRSAWSFSKTEIFNIYSSKSFFLPTPSPREVFRRRVDYLKKKISGGETEKIRVEYFVGKGIKVNIGDLEGFASVIENIFVDQDYAAKRIGELSNYNMRKTLQLSQRIITSSVLGIDDIIKSYITGEIVTPSNVEFMNALLKGDFSYFKADDKHHIFPVFQVDTAIRQSPLIHLRVLLLLRQAHLNSSDDISRYMSVSSICRYFDLMSLSEVAVQRSLTALLEADLIEPYDLSKKEYSQEQSVAIKYSGMAHLELSLSNTTFFEQMALTTRIANEDTASQIRGKMLSTAPLNKRLDSIRILFCAYLISEDKKFAVVPQTKEFAIQAALWSEMDMQWAGEKTQATVDAKSPTLVAEGVVTKVDGFDVSKGFGFVYLHESNDPIFLHLSAITAYGGELVHDGDELLCDISKSEKGVFVSKIYDIFVPTPKVYPAKIKRLFKDRGYGFVEVAELDVDAFFHYSLFPTDYQDSLIEEMPLTVEIVADHTGKWQVRRIVDNH